MSKSFKLITYIFLLFNYYARLTSFFSFHLFAFITPLFAPIIASSAYFSFLFLIFRFCCFLGKLLAHWTAFSKVIQHQASTLFLSSLSITLLKCVFKALCAGFEFEQLIYSVFLQFVGFLWSAAKLAYIFCLCILPWCMQKYTSGRGCCGNILHKTWGSSFRQNSDTFCSHLKN